jgi:hypothetical protein
MTHSCPARVRLAMCDSCITLNTTPMQKYTMPTTPRNLAKLPSSVTLNMYSNVPNISRPKPTNIQVLMISILITHQHLEESLIAAKSVAHTEDGANRETISLTSECRSRNFWWKPGETAPERPPDVSLREILKTHLLSRQGSRVSNFY